MGEPAPNEQPGSSHSVHRLTASGATPQPPNRYKWENLPQSQKPEAGLLRLRSSLNAFANLRPAVVLPQLADASTLKREVGGWGPGGGGGVSFRDYVCLWSRAPVRQEDVPQLADASTLEREVGLWVGGWGW